ncbi:hypothetical protein D3C79_464050 [compost metagenome]
MQNTLSTPHNNTAYTNELTQEALAGLSGDALVAVCEQQAYSQDHLLAGIPVCPPRASGSVMVTLSPSRLVRWSMCQDDNTGDSAVYPDGTTAEIIGGVGKFGRFTDVCSVALVGSNLSNGDEIIITLQGSVNILR